MIFRSVLTLLLLAPIAPFLPPSRKVGRMVPPEYYDEPNQAAIRPIVRDAALRNGMLNAPLFRTSDFVNAVVDGFGIKDRPSLEWGRDVLSKLDYVASQGHPDFWVYLGIYLITAPTE